MTTIPRRAVIAAIPALTIPAGAMANIRQGTGSDAELVSLQADLAAAVDAKFNAWVAQEEAEIRLWRNSPFKVSQLMDCGGCFTFSEEEAKRNGRPSEADLERLRARQVEYTDARRQAGMEPYDAACIACEDQWHAVMEKIAATPAKGLAGVSVKARIVAEDAKDGTTDHTDAIADSLVADLDRLVGGAS